MESGLGGISRQERSHFSDAWSPSACCLSEEARAVQWTIQRRTAVGGVVLEAKLFQPQPPLASPSLDIGVNVRKGKQSIQISINGVQNI